MVGSPRISEVYRTKPDWAGGYYVITRETVAHKSIYDHLTRMATVDEINKRERLEGAAVGQKLTLMLAASAMQIQRNRIKGTLA